MPTRAVSCVGTTPLQAEQRVAQMLQLVVATREYQFN